MQLGHRLMLAAAVLAAGVVAQLALEWHVDSGAESPYPELKASLTGFPLVLAAPTAPGGPGEPATPSFGWHGRDLSGLDEFRAKLPYVADDLVRRHYGNATAPAVDLYMVYSRLGEDRKHHPEICVRQVAGIPEDLSGRAVVHLDAESKRPVQRFRFRTGATQMVTIYYWHYTLDPVVREGQTFLQAWHQRVSRPAPSLTVQVSTGGAPDELGPVEKEFLVAVDSLLQREHLPATARMGCDRLPIGFVRE